MDTPWRTVIVTGANAGIGRRAADELARQGHVVVAVARDEQRGTRALAEIRESSGNTEVALEVADVADQASIRALAERLRRRFVRIDALINNAAVFDLTAPRQLTADGHERFWATNHLGPFLLTALLADRLADGGRVITIGSKGLLATPRIAIRFDETDGERWFTPTRAYYHSKLAQLMFASALARRFPAKELISVALRVPSVRKDPDRLAALPRRLRWAYVPKNLVAADPSELADPYARLAVGPREQIAGLHGAYVDERLRPVAPPRSARDAAAQDRLWELTSRQTGDPWPDWHARTR